MVNVTAFNSMETGVAVENLEIFMNVGSNIASSSITKEVIVENLETCWDDINENNQVLPDLHTNSQIGARDEVCNIFWCPWFECFLTPFYL